MYLRASTAILLYLVPSEEPDSGAEFQAGSLWPPPSEQTKAIQVVPKTC